MEEIWKDVPNYEGFYQVSNLGNVKSVNRKIIGVDGKQKIFKGKIIKQSKNAYGYLFISLSKESKAKQIRTHQLVAMAFLGHKPCGFTLVVDHIDNNCLNNNLNNLQVVTNRLNTSKDRKGTSKYAGVYLYKRIKKWNAQIYFNGKIKSLGYFNNEYDAHLAYQKALKEIL